ncbi:unnamed protein product, partial [Ostreobium quekettii]
SHSPHRTTGSLSRRPLASSRLCPATLGRATMPLGKRTDLGTARFAGLEVPFACDIVEALNDASQGGFDFVVVPLVHPRYRRPKRVDHSGARAAFTRSDLLLTSGQWAGQVVGATSPWINADSQNAILREDSSAALRQELDWAYHLGLQAVMVQPSFHQQSVANTARVIEQALESALASMTMWVRVPLAIGDSQNPSAHMNGMAEAGNGEGASSRDPWDLWNSLRRLCNHHSMLSVALELTESLPDRQAIQRYLGEPVKALIIPTRIFMTNKLGYPILSKRHQEVVKMFLDQNVQLVLSGPKLHTTPQSETLGDGAAGIAVQCPPSASDARESYHHPLKIYWDYLSYLFRRMETLTEQELLELGYRDHLQVPLEPLRHNLESQTYEVFERDAVKYDTYEEAVYQALKEWPTKLGEEAKAIVLMVVGAGRGPLVAASLKASSRAARRLKVYAIEKNPNAVVTLLNRREDDGWGNRVEVVAADMRSWEAPEQADILVSELLGSFGDNELSPECLDGAQRFLQPHGISIPSSYTSYMAPVAAFRAYNSTRAYSDVKHLETAYVVKMHNQSILAPPQPVFTFEHPNRSSNIDNSRYISITFERPEGSPGALMHGFAGYFETVLYKDVVLSTHPERHTPNMASWFPILFPMREPIDVPAGKASIEVHIWRCMAEHKVWYEWALTKPTVTPIHNPNGRSHWVGL